MNAPQAPHAVEVQTRTIYRVVILSTGRSFTFDAFEEACAQIARMRVFDPNMQLQLVEMTIVERAEYVDRTPQCLRQVFFGKLPFDSDMRKRMAPTDISKQAPPSKLDKLTL